MNIIEHKKYILVEVDSNNNKTWEIILYDDDRVVSKYARVGYKLNTKDYGCVGRRFMEKKISEKKKKGYEELKTIDTGKTVTVVKDNLSEIARKQIKAKSPELTKLIDRLVKANIHNIVSSTSIKYNADSGLFQTPLGIVTSEGIESARELLKELKEYYTVKDNAKLLKSLSGYLRLIPHDYGMRLDVNNIISDKFFDEELNILDSLSASFDAVTKNPTQNNKEEVDAPKIFNVELDVLSDKKEWDRLAKWFYGSNHRTHGYSNVKIQNIYSVALEDNVKAFEEKLGNITEVFHSTGEANLLSIFRKGLSLSPPSSTYICGALFGRGHYGAIDSSKSMQYTFGRFGGKSGNSGWCFVADFAMGSAYYIKSYGGKCPNGYDSIWATAKNTGLRFDELIVPKDNQVKLKYLIEIIK